MKFKVGDRVRLKSGQEVFVLRFAYKGSVSGYEYYYVNLYGQDVIQCEHSIVLATKFDIDDPIALNDCIRQELIDNGLLNKKETDTGDF